MEFHVGIGAWTLGVGTYGVGGNVLK